jgi:hypothetical protein
MMSDAEYLEFLDALARKHLRLSHLHRRHFMELDHLSHLLSRLENLRRLLSVAEQDIDDRELLKVIAKRLEHSYIDSVMNDMERCGIFDAIEEDPMTLFANLRRSAIPDEDIDMLRAAGHSEPEAEILLIIHYCRTHLGQGWYQNSQDARSPIDLARRAEAIIERVAKRLNDGDASNVSERPDSKKKRKLFNGVGKILSGGVLGAGNVLLGCGGILAPNPAIAYGVIGSSAAAIGSICQGVGDLCGE